MTHTTKHTPGPLKAVQVIIENSPCTWAVQRKSIREQWGKPSIATYIDNEADARLFAAAPAMYQAGKLSLDVMERVATALGRMGNKGLRSIVRSAIIEQKAALAQAEGCQS